MQIIAEVIKYFSILICLWGLAMVIRAIYGYASVDLNLNQRLSNLKPFIIIKSFPDKIKAIFNGFLKRLPFIKGIKKTYIAIASTAVITRVFIYFIGYMGMMLTDNKAEGFFYTFRSIWTKWDAHHYIFIAENWYVNFGDKRFLIVFYPLYPILIKLLSFIIRDYFLSAVILSNLCLAMAAIMLYKLVKMDYSEGIAVKSVKYLLIFPVSFFLGAPFTESLFILLTLLVIYYSRSGRFLFASLFGLLASFTRSQGILLFIPVFLEIVSSIKTDMSINSDKYTLKQFLIAFYKKGKAIFLIPVGTLIYLYINKAVTGNPFTFLKYQDEHWSQSFGLFFENMKMFFINAASWDPNDRVSLWIPQLTIILLAMILLIYGFKRIRPSYMVYYFVYLFVSISPTWLLSGPRYLMSAFPIYMALSLISENRFLDMLLTFIFGTYLCFCIFAYISGGYIM